MTEYVPTGELTVHEVGIEGGNPRIKGKLIKGSLSNGWKAKIGDKIAEVTKISIYSVSDTVFVVVSGVTVEDLANTQSIEFLATLRFSS